MTVLWVCSLMPWLSFIDWVQNGFMYVKGDNSGICSFFKDFLQVNLCDEGLHPIILFGWIRTCSKVVLAVPSQMKVCI